MNFFSVVGAVCAVLISSALVCSSAAWLMEAAESFYQRWQMSHRLVVAKDLGDRIANESYWFSENVAVRLALQSIGENISRYGNFDVDRVREDWRRALKEQAPGKAGG